MNALYDFGYSGVDFDRFVRLATTLDAVVLDIRYRPYSRAPQWNKPVLARRLLERYIHLQELGNVNYKNGGPILISDLDKGLKALQHYLENNSVIILCSCARRKSCHRMTIVEAFEARSGVQSIPLTQQEIERILDNSTQLYLF